MNDRRYDAIVVGARCAGSPTAMLLARKGYRVLLLDRARFPSDTVSTHLIHAPGVAELGRWGLLDRLVATGCPAISTYCFDFGPLTISGTPRPADGTAVAYCPRRTVLDTLLIDAAGQAGAEIREGFTVDELIIEDGTVAGIRGHARNGPPVAERARVVIGADGAHSRVAATVGADRYHHKPMLAVAYYSYWSGFPADGAGWAVRPRRAAGAFPTNDGLTMLVAAWPAAEFQAMKKDVERNYLAVVRSVFGDRLAGARREERVVGSGAANHFRTPYGTGWALVGDAGYLKDPVTAQGITDAFHDAELCTEAVDETFTGSRTYTEAMASYQRRRDARVLPLYEFTTQIGDLNQPPPPELLHLLGSIAGNQQAMDQFASIFAGTLSPAKFFDPARTGQLADSPI
jgi:flavin-dependent dehydrogenase